MRPVGYYVHHQGAGHWQRGCALAARLGRPCTLIGTVAADAAAPVPVLSLPDDRRNDSFTGQDDEPDRPLAFHYAPLGHQGVRDRMAAIARWAAETDPALLVVDVSVEVALLARLLSVPTIVVRLAGNRTDPAHLEAFRSAEALVAPFPEALDSPDMPDWVRTKTLYAGLLDPFGREPLAADGSGNDLVVLLGRGGEQLSVAALAAAAGSVPDRIWHVLGEVEGAFVNASPPNLRLHGWVADPAAYLQSASVLVGAGGDGAVGLAATYAKRFVCLPEPRAFEEQIVKARALAGLGAAVVREGWPTDWPAVIAEAAALDPAKVARLVRPDAIGWVAGQIDAIASRLEGKVVR